MLRGLYLAHTGMLTQQRRMDVVTNNLANATTAGFKQDDLLSRSFEAELIGRLEDPAMMSTATPVGTFSHGVHIDEVATSFEQGSLEETGLATDLALSGDAFFAVATPTGERYTRAGNFKVSAAGVLTTQEGWPVLGPDGPLNIGQNGFAVSPSGRIQTPGGSLQLRLVEFEKPAGVAQRRCQPLQHVRYNHPGNCRGQSSPPRFSRKFECRSVQPDGQHDRNLPQPRNQPADGQDF
jgi:flagellar basal-body rod protein FlgG